MAPALLENMFLKFFLCVCRSAACIVQSGPHCTLSFSDRDGAKWQRARVSFFSPETHSKPACAPFVRVWEQVRLDMCVVYLHKV